MPQEEVLDVLCVGFGPAGLSIATAMADDNTNLNARFLEKQPHFLWHGGMLLDDTRMQISFLKDMATLRDPTSRFTFLSYLHQNGRLTSFMNMGAWNPYRVEYNDYLQWVAAHFQSITDYNDQVVSVEPVFTLGSTINQLRVTSVNPGSGQQTVRLAKNIVIAIGGQPAYPDFALKCLGPKMHHPQIAHTAHYTYRVPTILPEPTKRYSLAVVGSGQSAVEVFMDLQSRYPNATVSLIFRDSALRPSDASPFVNEIFDPDRRDPFYAQSPQERAAALERDRSTNYSVVNASLIEQVYGMLYRQALPGSERKPHHKVCANHSVRTMTLDSQGRPRLSLVHTFGGRSDTYDQTFDAVFLGTGYARFAHLDMLKPVMPFLQQDDAGKLVIGRDYRVQTRDDNQCRAGIYVQGCCEDTHGLSDTLLSVLGVRGGEVLQAIKENLSLQASSPRISLSAAPPLSPPLNKPVNLLDDNESDHQAMDQARYPLQMPRQQQSQQEPSYLALDSSTSSSISGDSISFGSTTNSEPIRGQQRQQQVSSSPTILSRPLSQIIVPTSPAPVTTSSPSSSSSSSPAASPKQKQQPKSLPPIPAKPSAGAHLFSRFIPHLGETFSLRVVDPQTDIPLLTKWHNDPRISHFWNESGPESHQLAYISKLLADPHTIPCIGSFDNRPFAYFEIYWAAHDTLGTLYKADPYDRGLHLLIGEPSFRGADRIKGWMPSILSYMFQADPRTTRLVVEPRIDNGKVIAYLCNCGFKYSGTVQFPHKTAALLLMERPFSMLARETVPYANIQAML
ncbi:L-lysine 6-monooxygenase (NADPH-requiring)-domain-containing protein [Phlyctochytrium arcticum]|nr:L-lysine 6-monooxygenase (NADPH-requiring)-domain-containing protein [Phlyctochytrium arcticum]